MSFEQRLRDNPMPTKGIDSDTYHVYDNSRINLTGDYIADRMRMLTEIMGIVPKICFYIPGDVFEEIGPKYESDLRFCGLDVLFKFCSEEDYVKMIVSLREDSI